ncbi:hypothetical protein LACDD01_00150 [Lactococcus sp. DD01]|nr:hypothetical protein LACDD01_00150 [Lactococcus sp. DD01]
MEELKDIKPVATLGGEQLYSAEQMKQAYMSGVDYGYEARESHERLLNFEGTHDEEV